MPLPVKALPQFQNWDCHTCGDCCQTYRVRVTAEEKQRIAQQGWDNDPTMAGLPPTVYDKALGDERLNQRPDGRCVFLGDDRKCQIHAKFGAEAKPYACRLYPFVLVPQGDHFQVSLRFACPSVTGNKGRPCSSHTTDVESIARLVEAENPAPEVMPPATLQTGQTVPWADVPVFTKAFTDIVTDPVHPLELRLRQVTALAALCQKSKFDAVSGKRLREFLKLVTEPTIDEVPIEPTAVQKPSWVGRMLFRQQLASYLRQDAGPNAGVSTLGPFTRVRSAFCFAMGTGQVPRLHAALPTGASFAIAEQPHGSLPTAAESLLTRYYKVKLESGQFFGPTNFGVGYWLGLASLLLVYPMVLWATRVLVQGRRDTHQAVEQALQMIDDNFGYSGFLAGSRTHWAWGTLAERDEVSRLIAWYSL